MTQRHSRKGSSETKAWNAAAWQLSCVGNHICPITPARELGITLDSSVSLTPCSQPALKFSCLFPQIISRLETLFPCLGPLVLSRPLPLPCPMAVSSSWSPALPLTSLTSSETLSQNESFPPIFYYESFQTNSKEKKILQ